MTSSSVSLWKQAPFLKFLLPFVLGIVAGWYVVLFSSFVPLAAVGAFVVVSGLIYLLGYWADRKFGKYTGVSIFLILFLLGGLLSWWNNESLRADFAGNFLQDSSRIEVRLTGTLSEKENSWKAKVKLVAVENRNTVIRTRGNAFLYFEKEKKKPDIGYGDVLMIPNKLHRITNSGNPGNFDYKSYCKSKHVWYSGYFSKGEWQLLQRDQGSALKSFFINARAACVKILDRYIYHPREAGIAEALLLGYEENLDDELVQAFANIGVVHLIAISGMHVALIYLALLWLFRFIPLKNEAVKGLIIFLFLWGFTLLTGAHPSTLRATVMLSFFVAGRFFFHRQADPFNILAASALVLLCFDPWLFFDVGFQLSYLAVAGMLIFQRPVNGLFLFKYKLSNLIWKMMSVSIAAELLTFPLALYYFHQFPSIFLLSNLLLIPATTFVLYGEVFLLAFSFIPAVAKFAGMVLTKTLVLINGSILLAGSFRFVRWEYFGLSLFDMFLLYGCIIMIGIWLFYKNRKAVVIALCMASVLSLSIVIDGWKVSHQRKMIVYQVYGHSAIELVDGRQSAFYSDSAIWKDTDAVHYTLAPSQSMLGIVKRRLKYNPSGFLRFFDQKILVLRHTFNRKKIKGRFPVDYVILSGNNHLPIKEIARHFSPKWVILDASVRWWQKEKWKTACKQLNLHCFSVPDQGAWILSLK